MFSILLLCFQIDKDSISVANRINFDSLYDYANTLLVKFNNEKDSARKVFINSGAEGINYLVRKFDTKHAAEMSTLEEILKRMGRPAIEGILENINYRGTDEEARSLRLSLRIISEIFKFDSTLVGDDIVSRIEKFIYDQDWRVRGGVATALGYSKSRKTLPHLLVLIKDTINVVRKSAAFGIKNIAQPEDALLLLDLLNDDYYAVRYAAQEGLIKIGKDARDLIIDRLKKTTDPQTRAMLIKALAEIRDKKSIKTIKSYQPDPSPIVRIAVYETISDKQSLQKFMQTESDSLLKNLIKSRLTQ